MPPRLSIVSLLIPTALGLHGYRKKSLSTSGALTAFLVGFIMISGAESLGLKVWGVALIGFYLLGSRATKYGKERKRKLEAGFQDYGNRSGWQVLSNSFSAVLACSAWNVLFVPQGAHAWIFNALPLSASPLKDIPTRTYTSDWCPLDKDIGAGWSRILLFTALGHFACCLGDTLASELGILSSSPPRLITTGKVVPHGTNGGVSVGGTLASLIGGLTIGVMMSVCLVVENAGCRSAWLTTFRDFVLWGGLGGFGGSFLDSLLGATIQITRYDDERKLIVEEVEDKKLKVINGLNILTNNQVNVASSVCTAIVIALLA